MRIDISIISEACNTQRLIPPIPKQDLSKYARPMSMSKDFSPFYLIYAVINIIIKNGYLISVNLLKSITIKDFGIRFDDLNNAIIA